MESNRRQQQEKDIPFTIAMCADLLFIKEQQSSDPLSPGPAFSFIKALNAVNGTLKECYPESKELFRVLLVTDDSSDSQKTNFIRTHGLEELITLFPDSEENLVSDLQGNNTHLYLSTELLKAQNALDQGIAAAVMSIPPKMEEPPETQLRVAFDGDAVLFSNESELVFKRGLVEFLEHERKNAEIPMNAGPFKRVLEVLERLKRKLHASKVKICPIRTYLVTSRSGGCDGYRALKTLHSWDLEVDEAVFLGGSEKGPTLARIRPHVFFDDQEKHVKAGLNAGTLACLVPDGSQKPR